MSSVLLSLILIMFAVALALTSPIYYCIERRSSDISSGGADIRNCKSSANEWCMIECESIVADKGLIIYILLYRTRSAMTYIYIGQDI